MTHVILNPDPAAPFSNIGDAILSAISKLSEVLKTSIEKFPPKATVPKSLPPVYTVLPNLPAPDQPVPVPIQDQPTDPVPNSFNIIEDNEGNFPDISYNMPYPKYQPNIVPSDTPSYPRVLRYKLRPRKNLSHTGGISTRYNLTINLIQMM